MTTVEDESPDHESTVAPPPSKSTPTTPPPSSESTPTDPPPPLLEPITHKHHVKMQRLAKKRRLFLIQKLTRRLKVLRAKKGTEQQLAKNQRKVDRLAQKMDELKEMNLETVVMELVSENFVSPTDPESSTNSWYKNELLLDKFSFMAYVNPLLGLEPERKPYPQKHRKIPKEECKVKRPVYNEREDDVLKDILTVKKNRAGQRARRKQAEEKYGEKAKHLSKPDTGKKPDPGKKPGKRKTEDTPSAQEIMKRLKAAEKVKQSEKSDHPSWLAKKQQASQSAQIDVFAGTKTTFSDSD